MKYRMILPGRDLSLFESQLGSASTTWLSPGALRAQSYARFSLNIFLIA